MFNGQPFSTMRRLSSTSTLDSYTDFRNHLLSAEEPSNNYEDDIKTFPGTDKQNARQVSPLELKFKKPLNRLLSDVQGMKKSKVTGLNKKTKKETKKPNNNEALLPASARGNLAATTVKNTPVTRSSTRNKENNLSDCLKKSDVPEKRIKRKLFDTDVSSKEVAKKSKTVQNEINLMNQTNKSVGLSDTAVSIFLKKFDEEMAHESVGQPVQNLAIAPPSTEDLPNAKCNKKLPKRKSACQSKKTVAQLLQKEHLSHKTNDYDSDDSVLDKDFQIDEFVTTPNDSSSSDESEYIENKKDNFIVKEENVSVYSEADSICSIASNTSRYGRIRKAAPVYINATLFEGNSKKPEIRQKASTLINSHKCKSRPSNNCEDTSRVYPDQFDFLSPTQKRRNSPEFKKPVNQVTSSKNGPSTSRSRSRTLSSTSQRSSLIEHCPLKQNPNQCDFLSPPPPKKSVNSTPSSANGSNLSNSRRSQSRTSSNPVKMSLSISGHADKQNLNQSDFVSPPHKKTVSPKFNQTTPSTNANKSANKSNDQHLLRTPRKVLNKNVSAEKENNFKICMFGGLHETCPPPQDIIFKKPIDISDFKRGTRSSQNNATSPKSQKIVIHQNVVLRPPNEQEKPVKHVQPSVHNLPRNISFPRTSRSSISHSTFQSSNYDFAEVFDDDGGRLDPNEIHSVVNDEVVSIKWHAPTPDLDLALRDDNVFYSMPNLKSFYTNVMVGYLKVNIGHKKLMKVLRDCIMLYFVERGEAIFRVSEREIAGQIGSTFFIPLGVEYTITNPKSEDLILKFVKMSPTASMLSS